MVEMRTRADREALKANILQFSPQTQEALYAVLDRYVGGEDLSQLRCSSDVGEALVRLGRGNVITVDTVSKRRDEWVLDITVTVPDTLVGELWQYLHDTLE